jgi:acyl-CoA synthetase (AMP-forming)/AMP-acid ligase II
LGEASTTPLPAVGPDDTAAILFTSGSTGVAKGVVYRHAHFLAQVEMIRQTYGIEPGEVDLPTFPLFALFDPALGMTTVVPQMDFTRPANVDPAMLTELVNDWKVTNLFGSPAALNSVARYSAKHPVRWPTVRRVLSAGAPMPVSTLDGMAAILQPDAQVFTPYGATECLPVTSIGSRELADTREATNSGAGVCVGRVVAPNDVRIIAITDDPITDWSGVRELPGGEVGEVTVHGPTTTDEYFGRPEATRNAKIVRDGRIVHRMGDTGYLDAEGRLWFCGRKGQRVIVGDRVMHTSAIEAIFNTHPAVFRTALVGVTRGGVTTPVLCVEREKSVGISDAELFAQLLALGNAHESTRGIETFLVHRAFPVDVRHNAKIGREKLAVWASERLR